VAAHVLAQARATSAGQISLRVVPGGFATPPFGPDETVVRVSGGWLLVERWVAAKPNTVARSLDGSTLRELAAVAGLVLAADFSVGPETPPPGDPDAALVVDPDAVLAWASWMGAGVVAVDAVTAWIGAAADATVLQLWPEHFDAGLDVATPSGRCNLGMSPGDRICAEPYAYLGPWEHERPGATGYWNARFGAFASATSLSKDGDVSAALDVFFREGLERMGVAS